MQSSRPSSATSSAEGAAPYSPIVDPPESERASAAPGHLTLDSGRDISSSGDHAPYAAYNPGSWPGDAKAAHDRTPSPGRPRSNIPSLRDPAVAVNDSQSKRAWYLDDSDGEETRDSSPDDQDRTPRGPHQALFPDTSGEQQPPSRLRGRSPDAAETGLLARPRREQSATSYHTAYDSPGDNDTQSPEIAQEQTSAPSVSKTAVASRQPSLMLSTADAEELKRSESKKKSPGVAGFFGWRRGSHNPPESPSPTTTFDDSRSLSPSPSLLLKTRNASGASGESPSSPFLGETGGYFSQGDSYYGLASPTGMGSHNFAQVDDLVKELREVSAELAASIRREMELEDEVERYKPEMPSGPSTEPSRRTSDYYSDSGASSMPLPLVDSEFRIESLEKTRRKAEQETAQLKLNMTQKSQEEMSQRRVLEAQVHSLEASVEDTKRRLKDERVFKENFEELLSGMRQEIESQRSERDEISLENGRLQQENQSLRNENQTLVNARRQQLDLQPNSRFKTIAEEEDPTSPRSPAVGGLSRTSSLAKSKSARQRSGSMEATSESIKDLEDQRDALHRTLKSLILRQGHMTHKHEKQVRALEVERDRAMTERKRRAAYQFDIQSLRSEMNNLRRRADEAMEQKWQCERGLSGLKMDLDRAQEETTSLREMVVEQKNPAPNSTSSPRGSDTEETLDLAYSNLREVHASSVARLQSSPEATELLHTSSSRMDALSRQIEDQLSTNAGLRDRLREAIERGVAEQDASATKITNLETALRAAEDRVVTAANESEEAVAAQEEHARTMREAAAEQARHGLVRLSLPPTVTQRDSIALSGLGMPLSPLPGPGQLGISTVLSPSLLSPGPVSPLFTSRSPRLGSTTSGPAVTAVEAPRTEVLERQVSALERAAGRADVEMQGVVEKMNRAQIEVATLQAERDEANRQTRRLQREIVEERERMRGLHV